MPTRPSRILAHCHVPRNRDTWLHSAASPDSRCSINPEIPWRRSLPAESTARLPAPADIPIASTASGFCAATGVADELLVATEPLADAGVALAAGPLPVAAGSTRQTGAAVEQLTVETLRTVLDGALTAPPDASPQSAGSYQPIPDAEHHRVPVERTPRRVLDRSRAVGFDRPLHVDVESTAWQRGDALRLVESSPASTRLDLYEPVPYPGARGGSRTGGRRAHATSLPGALSVACATPSQRRGAFA